VGWWRWRHGPGRGGRFGRGRRFAALPGLRRGRRGRYGWIPEAALLRAQDLAADGRSADAAACVRESSGLNVLAAKEIVDGLRGGRAEDGARAEHTAGAGIGLVARVRELTAAGRADEAVRVLCGDAGMSVPQAREFVAAVRGRA
jgi:hypothetical protein